MTLYSGIIVFTMIWWLVLFTVLPWGIRRTENAEPGHAVEAPANSAHCPAICSHHGNFRSFVSDCMVAD